MILDFNDEIERFKEVTKQSVEGESFFHTALLFTRLHPSTKERLTDKPGVLMMGMPDMSDDDIRFQVKKMAVDFEGYAVLVATEVWAVGGDLDMPEEEMQKIRDLKERGELHLHPNKIELIQLWAETETEDIRGWAAEITREDGKPRLGEWQEASLTLPYPGWKRYLLESKDGKRVAKFPSITLTLDKKVPSA